MNWLDDRTNRYYFNTACQITLQGVGFLASLIVTPLFLRGVGTARYGLWGAVGAMFGFFGLVDMGIGSSFVYVFARPMAEKKFDKLWAEVLAGAAVYAALAVVLFPAALLLRPWLIGFIRLPPELRAEASGVFLMLLAAFVVRWVFIVNRSLLFAAERIDLLSAESVGIALLQNAAIIFVVLTHRSLVTLAALFFATTVAAVCCDILLVRRFVLPWRHIRWEWPELEVFRGQFRYGFKMWIVGLAEILQGNLNKIVIAHMVGVDSVAYYDIGLKAANFSAAPTNVLLPAITPAAAQWAAAGEHDKVKRFYRRLMTYTVMIAAPLVTLIVFRGDWLLTHWLRRAPNPEMVKAAVWLTIGQAAFTLTGPGRLAARGMGEPNEEMSSSLLMTACLLVNIPLIYFFGFTGALFGTVFSMAASSLYFLAGFHRRFRIGWRA